MKKSHTKPFTSGRLEQMLQAFFRITSPIFKQELFFQIGTTRINQGDMHAGEGMKNQKWVNEF
jgi:hypothetical protein